MDGKIYFVVLEIRVACVGGEENKVRREEKSVTMDRWRYYRFHTDLKCKTIVRKSFIENVYRL